MVKIAVLHLSSVPFVQCRQCSELSSHDMFVRLSCFPLAPYDRYHYRSSVENLEDSSVALGATGVSTNTVTQAVFNQSLVSELALAFELNATSNLDVLVATFDKNIFAYALEGTEGSAKAIESRADQITGSNSRSGPVLLRSDITMVEVSQEASIEPLADEGGLVTEPLEVKLMATVKHER